MIASSAPGTCSSRRIDARFGSPTACSASPQPQGCSNRHSLSHTHRHDLLPAKSGHRAASAPAPPSAASGWYARPFFAPRGSKIFASPKPTCRPSRDSRRESLTRLAAVPEPVSRWRLGGRGLNGLGAPIHGPEAHFRGLRLTPDIERFGEQRRGLVSHPERRRGARCPSAAELDGGRHATLAEGTRRGNPPTLGRARGSLHPPQRVGP